MGSADVHMERIGIYYGGLRCWTAYKNYKNSTMSKANLNKQRRPSSPVKQE